MPPKKKAADDGTGEKTVKKPRVARKKVPESGEGEKVEKKPRVARKSNMSAKLEVTDDVVEFVEVKIEGEEEKKARATRTKKPALSLEEIAEKGRGLVPGVTETVAPVKLGILYSQEAVIEESGVAKLDNDKYEDTDDNDDEDMCYICLCKPCQWIYYSEKVITHMRGVEEQLFVS